MTGPKESAIYALNALKKAGADKAQCSVTISERHEMNVDAGEFSLLRTTFDTGVALTAIKGGRRGISTLNKTDPGALDSAAADVLDIAGGSQPDDANDVAEFQPAADFAAGAEAPNLGAMHSRLRELLDSVKSQFPKAVLGQVIMDFTRWRTFLVNSNGVSFSATDGAYHCNLMFSSRDGDRTSSFNGAAVSLKDLGKELLACGSLRTLLAQSAEQIETKPLRGKFVGDVIYTPDCLGDLLSFLFSSVSDGPMIAGTSIYKDSLEKQVASPLLSVHARPTSDAIADKTFLTGDGYAAKDCTFLDRGVLKSYLLSLYGSRKTGKPRALNDGAGIMVDAGNTAYANMVKGVKRGLLLARFSGGRPGNSGDFAGVAKNSYYIEDGEIKYPVSETMVSGNFAEMVKNITAVSSERVDFGYAILPYVSVSGVTISGK